MATISTLNKDGTLDMTRGGERAVHYVELIVDLADAVTAKGSALAQGDIIETISVPAGTQVTFAGLQKISAFTGSSTDLTFDFGITGGDVDAFVDGWDFDAAAVNSYATVASAAITPATFVTTADTLDILFATQTGTVTGGKVRVFAWLADCSNKIKKPGIVQLGT